MRYLLQRARTKQWLTRDFELSDGSRTRALSGPGGINGTIAPEWKTAVADDGYPYLWEFGTIVYAEQDGRILNAGIVENVGYDERGNLKLEAPGFARYPQGIPYSSVMRFIHQDPIAVVAKHLWDHVQSFPNGDLDVIVEAPATPEAVWVGDNQNPYALSYWENTDCGGEFDNLARSTPFDYIESHAYTNPWTRDDVTHKIQIGYPRIGRKRTDLRFAEGENIVGPVEPSVAGGDFANELIGIGQGEGSAMIHAQTGIDDGRLRRPKVITDKTADQGRLNALMRSTLQQLRNVTDITALTVQDTPIARLSALSPGDDILVQASLPWLGSVRIWERIVAITESDTSPDLADLELRRSDSFIYSATTEVT